MNATVKAHAAYLQELGSKLRDHAEFYKNSYGCAGSYAHHDEMISFYTHASSEAYKAARMFMGIE